jgi:hypothetical protein
LEVTVGFGPKAVRQLQVDIRISVVKVVDVGVVDVPLARQRVHVERVNVRVDRRHNAPDPLLRISGPALCAQYWITPMRQRMSENARFAQYHTAPDLEAQEP